MSVSAVPTVKETLPKSAEFLKELWQQFGNLGLAAAAYNGGPSRVAAWLAGQGGLPAGAVVGHPLRHGFRFADGEVGQVEALDRPPRRRVEDLRDVLARAHDRRR